MTFETLLELSNDELSVLLSGYRASEEDIHDLQTANQSIRKFTGNNSHISVSKIKKKIQGVCPVAVLYMYKYNSIKYFSTVTSNF